MVSCREATVNRVKEHSSCATVPVGPELLYEFSLRLILSNAKRELICFAASFRLTLLFRQFINKLRGKNNE
jgi:hypothetical protein